MPRPISRLPLLILSLATAALLASCGSSGSTGSVTPPPTGHLAVADGGDNRILIYKTPLTATESASIVIGQTSFTQGLPNQGNDVPSAATLYDPIGLAMDAAGNLWAADYFNCRVLEFRTPFKTGMSASVVIGAPNFDTPGPPSGPYCDSRPPISPTYMGSPTFIAIDSQGHLWVVESSVGRIAEYVPPFSNGMAPSAVIGQTNLENSAPCNGAPMGNHGPILPPTSATLCGPTAIAFDSQGDLWVGDEGNVRILEFVPPFSTGMSASLEMVGQPPVAFEDNGTSCNATSASNFCDTSAIAFDRNGDLWLAERDFQRVLEFVPPFSNGMASSLVVGQPDFAQTGPWHPGTVGEPAALLFDTGGNLIVSKAGPGNSQILVYAPPFSTGMSPKTMTPQPEDPCPTSGPAANTLCGPNGVVVVH